MELSYACCDIGNEDGDFDTGSRNREGVDVVGVVRVVHAFHPPTAMTQPPHLLGSLVISASSPFLTQVLENCGITDACG